MVAATRFLLLFLLIVATTTTIADDEPFGQCDDGGGGDNARQIKNTLIRDLTEKVGDKRKRPFYCNELMQNGLKMFGYAECLHRGSVNGGLKQCQDCLSLVGNFLMDNCGDTGAGHAWAQSGHCSFWVGYSLEATCANGTYLLIG